jgi:queuosine precursor transporter
MRRASRGGLMTAKGIEASMARSSLAVRPAKSKLTVWSVVRAVLRLVIPVIALIAVYVIAYLNINNSVTVFDVFPDDKWFLNPGYWLTVGHLILPLVFLVSALTNRRYGDGYALAQLILSWLIIGGTVLLLSHMMGAMPFSPLPDRRLSLSFVLAIIVGQTVGIYVFDRTRGRTWWGAPLFSALWGQTVFILLFYTLAFIGSTDPWTNFMMMDLAIKVAAAFLMLIPYHLLRGAIRPLPGFGGA